MPVELESSRPSVRNSPQRRTMQLQPQATAHGITHNITRTPLYHSTGKPIILKILDQCSTKTTCYPPFKTTMQHHTHQEFSLTKFTQ